MSKSSLWRLAMVAGAALVVMVPVVLLVQTPVQLIASILVLPLVSFVAAAVVHQDRRGEQSPMVPVELKRLRGYR